MSDSSNPSTNESNLSPVIDSSITSSTSAAAPSADVPSSSSSSSCHPTISSSSSSDGTEIHVDDGEDAELIIEGEGDIQEKLDAILALQDANAEIIDLDDNDSAAAVASDDEGEGDEKKSSTVPSSTKDEAKTDIPSSSSSSSSDTSILDDSIFSVDHKSAVYCVAFNPKSDIILSGDGNDRAMIWSASTGKILFTLTGHTDSVIDCGFSFDGKYAATASMDGTVNIYNASTGGKIQSLNGPSAEIEWMSWHPSGPVLAAGSSDNTVWLWNAELGQTLRVFSGHIGSVLCGGFTHDGKMLLSGSEDGSVFIWSPKTGNAHKHIKKAHKAPVVSLIAHPSQPQFASASADGEIAFINLDGKILSALKGNTDSVEGLAFSTTHPYLCSGSVDGSVRIFDLTTGVCRHTLYHDDDKSAITNVAFHPSAPYLFSSSVDSTLKMWDIRSGENVRTWYGHEDAILSFDVSKDGKWLVSGADEKDKHAILFKVDK